MADIEKTKFDVNAPELLKQMAPEIDPDAIEERILPPPPEDGDHLLSFKPKEEKEGGWAYVKEGEKSTNTVIALIPRFLKEDGSEGQFCKDMYLTTVKLNGQSNHGIGTLCLLADHKLRKQMSLGEIKDHVELMFAEAPEGFKIWAETRWVMRYQMADENGMALPDPKDPGKDWWVEIRGEDKIKKLKRAQALEDVQSWERGEDETDEDFLSRKQNWIETSSERAHLFIDPVSGDKKTVQAEVVCLKAGPTPAKAAKK